MKITRRSFSRAAAQGFEAADLRHEGRLSYAERLVGSIRRECVDHFIVLGEEHLRLRTYSLYNEIRTYRSLDKDALVSRRFSELELSVHARSLADFITNMFGFRFSVHTAATRAQRRRLFRSQLPMPEHRYQFAHVSRQSCANISSSVTGRACNPSSCDQRSCVSKTRRFAANPYGQWSAPSVARASAKAA